MTLAAGGTHPAVFAAVFAAFVVLSLVLVVFVLRFAVRLDRARRASAPGARAGRSRRRPPAA